MHKNARLTHIVGLFWICLLYLCVHGGLFLFDLSDPAAFLRGDRGMSRFAKIQEVLQADPHSFQNAILNLGPPGDFLQHALLYGIGGSYALIAFQIALQLLTLVVVYTVATRLTGNVIAAMAAGLFLIVMPGALMNPHLLTTETWFTGFLMLGMALILFSMDSDGRIVSTSSCYAGFVGLALASAVRPQGILVPFVIAGCLSIVLRQNARKVFAGALLSCAIFPVSWMTLRFLLVGDFGLGEYDADFAMNLALRADRILGVPFETTGRLSLSAFAAIALAHPAATVNSIYSDALNLIFNPGANHLFGYYLRLFDGHDGFYWYDVRDKSGLVGVVVELLKQNATFLVLFVIWTILHLTILSGVAVALWRGHRMRSSLWIAVAVAATLIVSAFAAGQVRWDHRAATEPLLALLAAYGWFGRMAAAPSKAAF
jgi:hypothetical protein